MHVCNFCGRTQKDVKRMIAGHDVDICDKCVLVCMKVLIEEQDEYKTIEFKEQEE